MSQAFVRETDDQWLNEVGPTLRALTVFLTRENGGMEVYVRRSYFDASGKEIFVMSNGLSYGKNDKGEWCVVNN